MRKMWFSANQSSLQCLTIHQQWHFFPKSCSWTLMTNDLHRIRYMSQLRKAGAGRGVLKWIISLIALQHATSLLFRFDPLFPKPAGCKPAELNIGEEKKQGWESEARSTSHCRLRQSSDEAQMQASSTLFLTVLGSCSHL